MRPPFRRPLVVTFALVAGLGLATRPTAAETTRCTVIPSLPATITVPGIYCLDTDFNLSLALGAALQVNTNNVVIDLNGHKIGNLSAAPGTDAVGVRAVGRQNITVRNGTFRGFAAGLLLDGDETSGGHVIEDLRLDQNTNVGISVTGRGCLVRRNQVVATGGTACGDVCSAVGIIVDGPGSRVTDNDIIRVTGARGGDGIGILVYSPHGIAVNNRISAADRGIDMPTGSVEFRDNLTTGVVFPYLGGTNAGNNN